MVNEFKMQQLLHDTKSIVAEQLKIEEEKGETFNVFSVLKMEHKENSTHSAFLKELLDSNGSHLKKDLFLKLFLQTIGNEDFTLSTPNVKTEHSIGVRDDTQKCGGRVDIYITDGKKSIIIENKINAADQYVQIERYCNHNKATNKVYYLTLLGEQPSAESKGGLISGKDFFLLSYKKDIIEWLTKCLQECSPSSILRDSIRQYIILIKKITNTMDKKEKEQLDKLMLANFDESTLIAKNFIALKVEIGNSIRDGVKKALQLRLGNDFEVFLGEKIQNENAQLWIKYKLDPKSKLYFGIQSFSYNASPGLGVGILNEEQKETQYSLEGVTKDDNNLWPYWQEIESFEGHNFDFDLGTTLYKLYIDIDFKERFITYIVNEVEKFILLHKDHLLAFLKDESQVDLSPAMNATKA